MKYVINYFDFLDELGILNIREDNEEIFFSCPFDGHKNGDRNPSASFNISKNVFNCFGCLRSGNAVSFLSELEGVSYLKALGWIRERFGAGFIEPQDTLLEELESIFNPVERAERTKKQIILSEKEIEKRAIEWEHITDSYLTQRGFTPEILNQFQVGFDNISGRYTIPIRNEHDELVGFKARTPMLKILPRYFVLGGINYGFEPYDTGKVVFALSRAEGTEYILCEGELNTISCHQKGFTNTIGISGKYLTDEQAKLIRERATMVVLIFDETEDASRAARKLEPFTTTLIVPEHDKDPAEMEIRELQNLLDKSYSSLLI